MVTVTSPLAVEYVTVAVVFFAAATSITTDNSYMRDSESLIVRNGKVFAPYVKNQRHYNVVDLSASRRSLQVVQEARQTHGKRSLLLRHIRVATAKGLEVLVAEAVGAPAHALVLVVIEERVHKVHASARAVAIRKTTTTHLFLDLLVRGAR